MRVNKYPVVMEVNSLDVEYNFLVKESRFFISLMRTIILIEDFMFCRMDLLS